MNVTHLTPTGFRVQKRKALNTDESSQSVKRQRCRLTLVALAGVDLVKVPVLVRRWKVFNRVEVKLGFKVI